MIDLNKKRYDLFLKIKHTVEVILETELNKHILSRQIASSINTPTTRISKFLDQLDGVDLIHRLEIYVENDYFKPTTQLCTYDITDLYTILPQEKSLHVLTEFLLQHSYHKVKGIPIDAIRKLACIIITENVFIY